MRKHIIPGNQGIRGIKLDFGDILRQHRLSLVTGHIQVPGDGPGDGASEC